MHENKTIQQPTANLLCQRTMTKSAPTYRLNFKSILQHYRLKYQLF
ncbi:hypothetical protein [Helicobacter pylori]|nr:hypothetical protein [Helicobacter pylori]